MERYNKVPGLYSHIQRKPEADAMPEDFILAHPAGLDCRVRLAAIAAAALCAFILRSEWTLGAAALCCAVWLLALGRPKAALGFCAGYALLLYLQVAIPPGHALGALAMLASIVRRMMMPAFVAMPLAKAPTGVLLASLSKLRLPRPATVSLAVVFRFMPTVAGEYRAIRMAQKFRGIGVSAWSLLAHPARSYETILVPLLIRTTRIADELSASAMLRGAADAGKVTSFRPVRFGGRDAAVLVALILVAAALLAIDFWMR